MLQGTTAQRKLLQPCVMNLLSCCLLNGCHEDRVCNQFKSAAVIMMPQDGNEMKINGVGLLSVCTVMDLSL